MVNQKNSNPFAEALNMWNIPSMDANALLSSTRKTMETYLQASKLVAEGLQSATSENIKSMQSAFEESIQKFRKSVAAGDPASNAAQQAETLRHAAEQATQRAHESFEVVSKATNEALKMLSDRAAEHFAEISAATSANNNNQPNSNRKAA